MLAHRRQAGTPVLLSKLKKRAEHRCDAPPWISRPRPTLPCGDHAVPSALEGLTAVFGMGTGVSPPPWRPETLLIRLARATCPRSDET